MTNEEIKKATIELYKQLPADEEGRKARIDIRDKIIELNANLFGYIAAHKYVHNPYATYEDKLQSVYMHFCECWYKYQWEGHYRTDLSFGVFFKPRITEMMEREFEDVKYSVRRSLCMEVAKQLDKHWAKVTYDDLSDPRVKLTADKMNSLKAIFGSLYSADLETHEIYIEAAKPDLFRSMSDNYNSIHDFLIHEMIENESKLDDKKLRELSDMFGLDFYELKKELPQAEADLYKQLHDSLDVYESI